jgi:hypothetical protein
MTDLLIHCKKRDLALPLELTVDLAMQGSLVGLDCQEGVGALLLEWIDLLDFRYPTLKLRPALTTYGRTASVP